MSFANLAELSDKDIAAGTMKEMILVNPDAHTKYDGSMYSASLTTGDWEVFVAEDLVSYIDSHYRTMANRMSRGLGGHSMGGYGTVRIGMKRPDVFSSLYIMSACCLHQLTPMLKRIAGPPLPLEQLRQRPGEEALERAANNLRQVKEDRAGKDAAMGSPMSARRRRRHGLPIRTIRPCILTCRPKMALSSR